MKLINLLNQSYYKVIALGNEEYDIKVKELVKLCNEIKNEVKKIGGVSVTINAYLNEVATTSNIVKINWSDTLSREEKERLIENYRLMIEVYLGQAILIER